MENGIAIIDLGTNTFHLMIAKKKQAIHIKLSTANVLP